MKGTQTMEKNNIKYLTGEARYCYTTRPNDGGKFPSHCYEVGLDNVECEDKEFYDNLMALDIIKIDDDTNERYIKIANSKFPIPMFNMSGKEIDKCKLPNGTKIMLAVSMKHNDKFDKDYLVCLGVKLLEDYKPFNPFE